ncbi:MAG: aldo/keto reductase [Promethearchaeota archaeon]
MGSYATFDVHRSDRKRRENVLAVIRAAIEHGTNLFDTANMYGNSEDAIGESLTILKEEGKIEYGVPYEESLKGQKPKIYIATKAWASSLKEAERQIKNSFKVLQTDYIDLFQIHNLSIWKELLPILKDMCDEQQIGAIGVTHYSEASYPEMLESLRTGDIDVVQVPYNISQTRATQEIFPETQKLNLGVLIMTPITPLFRKGFLIKKLGQINLNRFEKYGTTTPGQVLLKFVISHPAVTAAIPATSKVWRVAENTAVSNGVEMDNTDQDFLMKLPF